MMDGKDIALLKELTHAGGEFVSGSKLAQIIGVSRVSVWGRLEKLKDAGFAFEAVRNRGYRITDTPRKIHSVLLAALCEEGLNLHYKEEVDSTNDEIQQLLASGQESPIFCVSSRQLKGRGRLGRQWHSEDQGNLYISMGMRPMISPLRMQRFTLWMGLRICQMLTEKMIYPIMLKWPNDLVIKEKGKFRKLAGMLTEARVDADHIRDLVFGFGLNVSTPKEALPPDLAKIAVSLYMLRQERVEINSIAADVISTCMSAYREFLAADVGDELLAQWPKYDALLGERVTALRGQEKIIGTANGINQDGCLRIDCENGETIAVAAGEVTLAKK